MSAILFFKIAKTQVFSAARPVKELAFFSAPIKASCTAAKGKDIEPATKDHVHHTAEELLHASPVLKQRFDQGKLAIVEAYYSLDTGKVERLK